MCQSLRIAILICFHLSSRSEAFLRQSSIRTGTCRQQSTLVQVGATLRRGSVITKPKPPASSTNFVATCVPGLSRVLAGELEELGCTEVEATGGAAVRFQATGAVALKTLLWARTPHKIMEFLGASSPSLQSRQDLHQFVYNEIPVQSLLGNGQGGLLSLSVSTILNSPRLLPADVNHSHFTALTVKNALCDAVRDLREDRPNVDLDNPDVPLVAVLRGTPTGAQLSLYRQIHSSGSLHKRGYRPPTIHKAALKESLAAGLLLQAGWYGKCRNAQKKGDKPPILIDPMTGSGTLVLEGLSMAADVAPHLMRIKTSVGAQEAALHQIPPMLRWKDYAPLREEVWPQLLRQATTRAKTGLQWLRTHSTTSPDGCRFQVNDMHTGALALLEESLLRAGLDGLVEIRAGDCADWQPKSSQDDNDPWTVVCNPPWGVRLEENVEGSWQALGDFLKQNCPAGRTKAWILSGDAKATKLLHLRRSQSMPVKVGTQDLRWLEYELHAFPPQSTSSVDGEEPSLPEQGSPWQDETSWSDERPTRPGNRVPKQKHTQNWTKNKTSSKQPANIRIPPKARQEARRVPTANDNEWLID